MKNWAEKSEKVEKVVNQDVKPVVKPSEWEMISVRKGDEDALLTLAIEHGYEDAAALLHALAVGEKVIPAEKPEVEKHNII